MSEGNHLQGILRKTNKKRTNIYIHRHTRARANQRHTHHHRSSRVCEWSLHVGVRACVCWSYFANLSTLSVCLPVHTMTLTLTHTHTSNTRNKGKYTSSHDRKSTLSLKHSISVLSHDNAATRNTHTHRSDESPAKMSSGRADNWLLSKSSVLYRGETEWGN